MMQVVMLVDGGTITAPVYTSIISTITIPQWSISEYISEYKWLISNKRIIGSFKSIANVLKPSIFCQNIQYKFEYNNPPKLSAVKVLCYTV